MDKLGRLFAAKRSRDVVSDVSSSIMESASCKRALPHFYISSAAAAQGAQPTQRLLYTPGSEGRWIRLVVVAVPAYDVNLNDFAADTALPLLDGVRNLKLVPLFLEPLSVKRTGEDLQRLQCNRWREAIRQEEALLELTLRTTTSSITVPLYYVKIPILDDGSSRLADFMGPLTEFFDDCCCADGDVGRLLLENTLRIQQATVKECNALSVTATTRNAVLVHCMQGISRSVSIVLYYLLQRVDNLSYEELLQQVRKARACAAPNLCFAVELKSFELKQRIRK